MHDPKHKYHQYEEIGLPFRKFAYPGLTCYVAVILFSFVTVMSSLCIILTIFFLCAWVSHIYSDLSHEHAGMDERREVHIAPRRYDRHEISSRFSLSLSQIFFLPH